MSRKHKTLEKSAKFPDFVSIQAILSKAAALLSFQIYRDSFRLKTVEVSI